VSTTAEAIKDTALVVVDVQRGFDDPSWGRRSNPACEKNVGRLIAHWRELSAPVVFVRHDSRSPESPLSPRRPGNPFKPVIAGEPDLFVRKQVHSAFFGTPDLDGWLREHGLSGVAVCGIQTNFCCETTARMAANLGYDLTFVLDATHTFDLPTPDGGRIAAEDLERATAANLAAEFGSVVSTDSVVGTACWLPAA
jgi:nicotinamidase-related amidase